MAGNRPAFLVESALLTHGLLPLSDADLLAAWREPDARIAYVDGGQVRLTSLEDYLPFRARHQELMRIDCDNLDQVQAAGGSGALTASGTMAVCANLGIPLAVTAGMGGIGRIATEELSPDLPALATLPVTLLATAPKDMLDYPATFAYLRQEGVRVLGLDRPVCDGYLFTLPAIELDGLYTGQALAGRLLLLQGLAPERRLTDPAWLELAIQTGVQAEREGAYYHPAVNQKLAELSDGRTTDWQFQSLLDKVSLAARLTGGREGLSISKGEKEKPQDPF